MRILHVTAFHSLYTTGGTERYIDTLIESLTKDYSVESKVLILSDNPEGKQQSGVTFLYSQSRSSDAVSSFRQKGTKFLKECQPNCIFFHTAEVWEAEIAELARGLDIPYFFFFHAPYWLCRHKDLSYLGKRPCENIFAPWRCSICMSAGQSGSHVRGFLITMLGECNRLILPRRDSWLHNFFYESPRKAFLVQNASKVVVFTHQDAELLSKNGVSSLRLAVIPQGISESLISLFQQNAKTERAGTLKIGYIGRATEIKGCHLLVQAMQYIPSDASMELHIYGCNDSSDYLTQMKKMANRDKRVIFHPMMSPKEIIKEYRELDVLCIPSIVFETGPLTLFEGIYSGCRVYGSNQIGQADILKQYGEMIPQNTPEAWSQIFLNCNQEMPQIRSKKKTDFDYRTMSTIAGELLGLIPQN